MTAIEAHEPTDGDVPLELDGVLDRARYVAAAPASTNPSELPDGADPALQIGRRLLALESGNDSQQHLARLLWRALDLAEAVGRVRTGDGENATSAEDDRPGGYRIALEGVDAIESIESALNATKARLITDAYSHAREELLDPTLSPGQRMTHIDGSIDHVLSREQIAGADLSVIVNLPPGLAKYAVSEATKLVQYMPHTLARLEAGELTAYHRYLIVKEARLYPPVIAQRLDELVSRKPFTGRLAGTGDHRATTRSVTSRLDRAVAAIGFEPPGTTIRKGGFAGRYVRFALTGDDGMTRLHGSLPSVHAKAINTLLDDLAGSAPDGDQRTVEQQRSDAFLACFTGPAALSPAAQLALDLSAPSFDEHGQYTIVDERQNLEAQSIWDTMRLLAAGLGLTFPDVPRAVVNVDVSLETLTGEPCPARMCRCPSPGTAEEVCPGTGPGARPLDGGVINGAAARYRAATLRGVGPIPDALAQRLARFAALRRVVTDPLTGQPLEVGRRRPSERLYNAVLNRDRHCRFPGCTRTAVPDLDHISPYRDDAAAEEQTVPENLQCLCREHHRVKHQLRWHPAMQPDGTIRWRNNLLGITAVC